ncbi:transposase [Bradyrhizobium sp. LM6.9]
MDFYAGLDVSLEATNICVVDGGGKVVREAKLDTDPDAIELFLAEWGIQWKRVGLEAFSYSAWPFTALSEKGLPVICIETRHAKAALNAMPNKTDRNDAKGIAQMMRTGWFRAVHVKSEAAQNAAGAAGRAQGDARQGAGHGEHDPWPVAPVWPESRRDLGRPF